MQLQKEIDNLNQTVLMMSDIVLKNLKTAFSSYKKESPIEMINDDIVDNYERLIEELCLDVLIKERPYSKDLRVISGILKLVSDLERIGDHAEDVMEFSAKLRNEDDDVCQEVDQMVEICLNMVTDAINSYITLDVNKASSVIKKDDIFDKMYDDALKRLIEKNSSRSFAIYTTLVVKYIERVSDHAVNIAEWVIYIANGYYKDKKIF